MTTPTPDTWAVALGGARAHDAVVGAALSGAVLAVVWVALPPAPLVLLLTGAVAMAAANYAAELVSALWALWALRALRRCAGCRAAEVASTAADDELRACRGRGDHPGRRP